MIDKKYILDLIRKRKSIIWDFDGVIKDSVSIKGKVFQKLFLDQDKSIKDKILEHHKVNGGVSRFKKLGIYLDWSSYENSNENINIYASKFRDLVIKEVIDSNYIDGAKDYLEKNFKRQNFYLVSATPQEEIIKITKKLKIFYYFIKIYGSPLSKEDCFRSILESSRYKSNDFIAIGDSLSEYNAAKKNNLDFILRIDKSKDIIPEWYIEKDLITNNFISE